MFLIYLLLLCFHQPSFGAGPFGINGYIDFVDWVHKAKFAAVNGGNYTEDSNGWPTSDMSWEVFDARRNMMWSGPDPYGRNIEIAGTYHLSFVGQATIGGSTEDGNIQVSNQQYDNNTGITTADVTVPTNRYLFFLTLTNTKRTPTSAANSGFTNLHLIKDNYPIDTKQLFTSEALNAYGPGFDYVRLLGIDNTNNYATLWNGTIILYTYWKNRPKVGDAYQYGTQIENAWPNQGRGVAWEYVIQFCNQLDISPWINVPVSVDDEYVTNLANLFKYGSDGVTPYTSTQTNPVWPPLKSSLKIYLEYSNEVWNWGFAQATWNQHFAVAENISNDAEYVKRSYQIVKIFQTVYGSSFSTTIRAVLLWQYGNWNLIHKDLLWLEDHYQANIKSLFYGIGEAPYVNPDDHSSVDTILDTLMVDSDKGRAAFLGWQGVTNFFGIKEVGYESGPSLGAGIDATAMRDPRLTEVIRHHYVENYFGTGSDAVGYFAGGFGAASSCGGSWSQGEDPYNQHNVKMDGILQVIAAPQPPVHIGQALPVVVGDTYSANFLTPDTWGMTPNINLTGVPSVGGAYLFRSGANGVYKITLHGHQDNLNISAIVYFDDVVIGTVQYPTAAGDAASVTTGTIGAGLHAFTVKYVYINGQITGKAYPQSYKISLVSGGGSPILPNYPTNPGFKATSSGEITLFWDASNGATSYNIYQSSSGTPYGTFTKIGVNSSATGYVATGLTNGKYYYYAVTAVNSVGETVKAPMIAAQPFSAKPNQPANLKLQQNEYQAAGCGNGGGFIILTWDPVPEVTKYNIKRANGGDCSNTTYKTTMTPYFTDSGLDATKVWSYCVSATNQLGEGLISTSIATTTWSAKAPSAPTNLIAIPTNKGIQLYFTPTELITPSTDPEYRIYRATVKGGPYTLVMSESVSNVTDWSVDNGVAYYYVVRSHGSGGESGSSNEVTATASSQGVTSVNTGGAAVAPFVADTVTNSGTQVTTTTTIDLSYVGSKYAAPVSVYQSAHQAASGTDLTYTLSGLVPLAPYHLNLHFAEINAANTQVGARVFNVNLNNGRILSNYDIIRRVGKVNTAFVEYINAWADNSGKLTLTFSSVKGLALINAIEVY